MKLTWDLRERIFKDNFKKRIRLFGALMGSGALYGTEIWEWYNEERIDRIMRRYVKWILELDREMPNYIFFIEECNLVELRIQAIRRVIKNQEEGSESDKKLLKECIKEIRREKTKKAKGRWERRRREIWRRINLTEEELERGKRERVEKLQLAVDKIWRMKREKKGTE